MRSQQRRRCSVRNWHICNHYLIKPQSNWTMSAHASNSVHYFKETRALSSCTGQFISPIHKSITLLAYTRMYLLFWAYITGLPRQEEEDASDKQTVSCSWAQSYTCPSLFTGTCPLYFGRITARTYRRIITH